MSAKQLDRPAPGPKAGSPVPARPELQVLGCAAQHIGDRKEQQDRVAILTSKVADKCVLGLLADGLGGRTGGAIASENVLRAAQRVFDDFSPDTHDVQAFFKSLVSEMHTVLRLSAWASRLEPHSTLAALLIQPNRADWCHVGDSRIYHFRNEILLQRTEDHTFENRMVREGEASAERAHLHPNAQLLTNALGGQVNPVPSLMTTKHLAPGDRFVLCSDGLWHYFSDQELARTTATKDLRAASATLIEAARQRARGHGDNCSMVLFGLEQKS